eukprot:FR736083.1.p2 GENE.FR736083.1~~FR736083.1.p2  ORF type:complete len:100 (+),score=3.98 FR736083.1:197-496(+)
MGPVALVIAIPQDQSSMPTVPRHDQPSTVACPLILFESCLVCRAPCTPAQGFSSIGYDKLRCRRNGVSPVALGNTQLNKYLKMARYANLPSAVPPQHQS